MSEAPVTEIQQNPEVLNRSAVESFEATLSRVKEVPFVYSKTTPNSEEIDYVLDDQGWKFSYRDVEDVAVPLDPLDPEDNALLHQAEEVAASDDTTMNLLADYTRWWERSRTPIPEAVAAHIQDRLVIANPETEEPLDIVNATHESLSDEEQSVIEHTMNLVANFTGNKVFDRVRGIILAEASNFDEGTWGGHSTYNAGIITVNLEAIREAVKADPEGYTNRFTPYFPDADPLEVSLAMTIAHELGHTMDIRSTKDAEAMGVLDEEKMTFSLGGMTGDFSIFDEGVAWNDGKRVKDPNGSGYVRDWKIDPAQEVESREEAPTQYGRTNPKEDFAETFAILALGGDKTKLPTRVQVMADGLQKLHQADLHGPFQLDVQRVVGEPLQAKIPTQLVLKAGISKELVSV